MQAYLFIDQFVNAGRSIARRTPRDSHSVFADREYTDDSVCYGANREIHA